MRLSDYKGRDALDVLADIMIPTSEIFGDKEVRKASKISKAAAVSVAIKQHPDEVIEILARLDNKAPEEYENEISLMTLPSRVLEVITDKELMAFFRSQSQTMEETSTGSATENTEASAK